MVRLNPCAGAGILKITCGYSQWRIVVAPSCLVYALILRAGGGKRKPIQGEGR
jgi:hypothetical protein